MSAIFGLFGGSGLTIYRMLTEQPIGLLPLVLVAIGAAGIYYGLARGFEEADSDD